MVEVCVPSPIQPYSEILLEVLNNLKPKLMRALEENSYLSELQKTLDDKSKSKFYDIIALHPKTSLGNPVKEQQLA